ncbi:MAG: N-acetyltransferase family protein, partial [Candidatus Kariarchaeaceae archaeon]
MRFLSSKNDVHIRDAKLDDSEILSLLQWEHLQKYSSLDIPKTPESYRHAIGSSLLKGDHYLVAEDDAHEVIGFLEQKKQNPTHVKIGYPYVSFNHTKRKDVQFNLLNQTIHRLKDIGVKVITTEISNHIVDAVDLYSSLGFDNSRIIFQSWEGPIEADYEIGIEPYEIRRVKQKDLNTTYHWISQHLDRFSPLNI